MPTPTYVAIAKSTPAGAGGIAGIDFTSIPSTYTDLLVVISARSSVAAFLQGLYVQFNGSSATNYSYTELYGYNATTGSFKESSIANTFIGQLPGTSGTSNTFGSIELYIPNYAGSTNKPMSTTSTQEINSTTNWQGGAVANLWSNTAAINRIYIYGSSNLAQYSSAWLYGIKNS